MIRLAQSFNDVIATTELAETVTFIESAWEVSLPNKDATGQQALQFQICNVTGDGTSYQVQLGAAGFNNGMPWNTSTNTFTAPVTGIYSFSGGCRIQGGGPSTFAQLQLVQSGSVSQTSQAELDMTTNITLSSGTVTGSGVYNLHIADTFAMQAGDTLAMKIAAFGSTKTMSIPASSVQTWLSGVIVG